MIIPTTPKVSRKYFTQETEDAIVAYNNSEDLIFRSRIYNDKIHYAFFKLTENIIHTFKFYHTEVNNITHLQHEIIVFLLTKIHLYDQSKGSKAFSYFGTIVKRWLILYNDKNYKKKIINISIDEFNDNDTNFGFEEYFEYEEEEKPVLDIDIDGNKNDRLSDFVDEYIEYCTDNIFELFPKGDDAKIADAILELFRRRGDLELFNKKALYIYIKEIIPIKTPKITKIVTRLKIIFQEYYSFYIQHGYTNFP